MPGVRESKGDDPMKSDLFGGETCYPPDDMLPDDWEDAEDRAEIERARSINDRWDEVSYGS